MITILNIGIEGQLGNEIKALASQFPQFDITFTTLQELDITNIAHLNQYLSQKYDYIINCAAYTAVDNAEKDVERCYSINADAMQNIGLFANKSGSKVIHFSTDYVFDGNGHFPYKEDFPTAPSSIYGKSKLKGEELLLEENPNSMVIRTSWLYSEYGHNFVKTMIKLGKERPELKVIFDQVGTPTYAGDLALATLQIIDNIETGKAIFTPGIYHFSNEGVCSWFDFALKIHQLSGITTCKVYPIESSEYPVPTPRPHYSVLNKNKIKSTYHIEIPHWEKSLEKCLQKLNI